MQSHSQKLLFYWRGITADGLPDSGWSMAYKHEDLSQHLATNGITLIKARKQSSSFFKTVVAYHFLEQLASLLNAGMPILEALELVKQDKNSRQLQAIFCGIIENVKSGLPLSESIKPFLKHKDHIILRAMALGERSGKFDEILARLMTQYKKTVRARSQLTRAAVYPAVLLIVSVAVILIMMVWAVPEFKSIYADFGAQLPVYTLAVITFSEFIIAKGFIAVVWCVFIVGIFIALQHASPRFKRALARIQLHIPIAGHLLHIRLYRQFAADMNLIYRAGMPLGEALNWLASTSPNLHYCTILKNICGNINNGSSLNKALDRSKFFSPFIVQTIRIGENSGSLEQAFERVELFYDEAIENTTDKLVKLFEPLLVAILSLIVGSLLIAMYLPIFNLGFVL